MEELTKGEEKLFLMCAQMMVNFGVGYLYSSLETLLVLLRQYHNRDIRHRMICYNFAGLTGKGLVERRCRNKRNPDGTYEPMTSLTIITKKGYKYLVNRIQQNWRAANKVVKKMLRYERKRKPQPAEQPLSREDSKEMARELQATLAYT